MESRACRVVNKSFNRSFDTHLPDHFYNISPSLKTAHSILLSDIIEAINQKEREIKEQAIIIINLGRHCWTQEIQYCKKMK